MYLKTLDLYNDRALCTVIVYYSVLLVLRRGSMLK